MYAISLLLNKPRLELALLDEDQTMAEPALAELLTHTGFLWPNLLFEDVFLDGGPRRK